MMDTQIHLASNEVSLNSLSKSKLCDLINSNLLQIAILTSENTDLKVRNKELENDKKRYDDIIDSNRKLIKDHEENIKRLEKENGELRERIKYLEEKIVYLEERNNKLDALVKLNECNILVNNTFKKEYMKEFNKNRYDYIPNIGDFIRDPPTLSEGRIYEFWERFKKKYPRSDDKEFRSIYYRISESRADVAHPDITKMTRDDFDRLITIAFPEEYKINKKLFDDYRDWLFLFPAE